MNFLGQDLYRLALSEQALEPFAAAADTMEAAPTPQDGANAFKALRFGLAGLVLRGWEQTIMEPLPTGPIAYGDTQITHGFVPGPDFPLHDHGIFHTFKPAGTIDTVRLTQGEFALRTIGAGLTSSAERYLSDKTATAGGIPVTNILDALAACLVRGHQLGFDQVPDMYDASGQPIYQDVYKTRSGKLISRKSVVSAIRDTARNPIRFTRLPVEDVMHEASGFYPAGQPRRVPRPDAGGTYDSSLVAPTILATFRHATRASQRIDGDSLVQDDQALVPNSRAVMLGEGGVHIAWKDMHQTPPEHVRFNPEVSLPASRVAVTTRNKCPIGYTANAFDSMPLHRIYGSIAYALITAGLDDPGAFSMPKTIADKIAGSAITQ